MKNAGVKRPFVRGKFTVNMKASDENSLLFISKSVKKLKLYFLDKQRKFPLIDSYIKLYQQHFQKKKNCARLENFDS